MLYRRGAREKRDLVEQFDKSHARAPVFCPCGFSFRTTRVRIDAA
jgi:hypothetical protein